jgi:hypothetical protein
MKMKNANREWISYAECGRRLNCSIAVVRRLVQRGQLTARLVPGTRPRVLAADLARLSEQYTRPATRPETTGQTALLKSAPRADSQSSVLTVPSAA